MGCQRSGRLVIGTGRSDFPNQINNSLGFPGIFRGTLDVAATTITDGMCIAAATELAKCARRTRAFVRTISSPKWMSPMFLFGKLSPSA